VDLQEWLNRRRSRRRILQGLGIFAGTGLALESGIFTLNKARALMAVDDANAIPINHILIACQENRTFDNYFGYYSRAGKFGVPAN
jgi:phospholipase C